MNGNVKYINIGENMISVIIPVYNLEEYLHVCLNSVLKQTYQDFEIICIDDASTDSSLEILEYFNNKDSRVKIIKNDSNHGPGYSRNKGLDAAQGKYISFLDGDDWFSLNTFEILIKKIEQDNLDVLLFKNIVYYDDSQDFGFEEYYDMEFMNKFENKVFNHWDLDKTKLFNMSNAPWNKLYLKSFLDDNNIRFPNENLVQEDNPFFYKVITSAKKVSIIDKYLHNRRRRQDSIMTLNDERLFDNIEISYKILDIFFNDKELYGYYKKELLTHVFAVIFKGKYNKIADEFKEEFFKRIQEAFKVYIKKYGLYNDIKENVTPDVLEFFKFEEIVEDMLSPNPKISVIIPVYNVEKYLNQCLDSVINQNFSDMEIICVNDGSTDSSLDILESYAEKDNRINIINQKNCGLGCARNVGLANALGDYILFLDSDDFLSENCLNELYLNAINNDSDLIIFKYYKYDDVNEEYYQVGVPIDTLVDDVDYNNFTFTYEIMKHHVMNSYISAWARLYKKEFLDKHDFSFQTGIAYEDVLFQIKSFLLADSMSFFPINVYTYRISNPNSLMHDSSKIFDIIIVLNSVEKFLKEYSFFDEFEYEFLRFRIRQLSQYIPHSRGDDYFEEVKKEFIQLADKYDDIDRLPEFHVRIFNKVLNSNNLNDYMGR